MDDNSENVRCKFFRFMKFHEKSLTKVIHKELFSHPLHSALYIKSILNITFPKHLSQSYFPHWLKQFVSSFTCDCYMPYCFNCTFRDTIS